MPRKKYKPEEIVAKLRQVDVLASQGTAIREPWSNGQVEGHVNKLKLVKRQMYGRAKIDLLEARLIGVV
ncbi:MAG: hypothetical protein P8Z80_12610 [Pseudolabrys sp.]|jgi:transposase